MYRRLPLHCAVDKICCNAQLVQILVDAYPEGASLEDDDGFSPLSCALRWEHSDKILRIILLENRYQYRGLYFAMRYGKIIGSILHCMECTFRKPKTQAMQPYSMSASDPCDDIIDAGQSESGDGASADGVEEEVRGPPALFISPATSLMGIDTGPSKSPKSGFAGGYPEIILKENPKLDREDSSQETLSPHGSKDIY